MKKAACLSPLFLYITMKISTFYMGIKTAAWLQNQKKPMMGGGIWLRYSGLVPNVFIAVFYTGLGLALALDGVIFWIMFVRYPKGVPGNEEVEKDDK